MLMIASTLTILIVMLVHPELAALQCAILLNMSKCSLLQRDWSE